VAFACGIGHSSSVLHTFLKSGALLTNPTDPKPTHTKPNQRDTSSSAGTTSAPEISKASRDLMSSLRSAKTLASIQRLVQRGADNLNTACIATALSEVRCVD